MSIGILFGKSSARYFFYSSTHTTIHSAHPILEIRYNQKLKDAVLETRVADPSRLPAKLDLVSLLGGQARGGVAKRSIGYCGGVVPSD